MSVHKIGTEGFKENGWEVDKPSVSVLVAPTTEVER
jgi:hypothetical protein